MDRMVILLLILENDFSSALGLRRSSDKEVTFCAYPHLTALRRKISILLVNSNDDDDEFPPGALKITLLVIQ